MKTITALSTVLMMAVAGCQTADPMAQEKALAADGWQRLGKAEMLAATIDTTHTGTTGDGRSWTVYYTPDGIMRGSVGNETDAGTYSVSDTGVYCRSWTSLAKGREGCANFYRRGNEMKAVKVSGEINVEKPWTVEPGNTRSL